MKKIKRELNKILDFFKGIRISTIYKLIGIALFIGILIWVFSTINKSEKTNDKQSIILTGTIVNKGEDYIIIKDNSNKEYKIPVTDEEKYPLGSDVNANVGNVVEKGDEKKPTSITSNEVTITNEKTENKNADEEIITYITESEDYFTSNDTSLKEEGKMRFITIVDFLFYNGYIKGYTIKDITSKTKLQALKITLSIDNKIENYFPGYKESISTTTGKIYTGIKNKIIGSYLTITTKICTYDPETCKNAKNDFQQMKQAFSITWNTIRNLITNSTDNLKEWYEIFSGKTS